jgi:hypothetical protein
MSEWQWQRQRKRGRSASARRAGARVALAGALALSGAAGSALPAAAQAPAGCSVFASDLAQPRFVAVGLDNAVYVTEAGSGGSEQIERPAQLPPQVPVASNRGTSGRITRIAPDGSKRVVATGLPSYGSQMEVNGAGGIAVAGNSLWVAVGNPGPLTPFVQPLPADGSVHRVDIASGNVTKVADLGQIERANNPDGTLVDTNLYGLAAAPNGTVYVADAGGNSVLAVNPANGQARVLATIPGLPSAQPNPARGGRNELDPVPSGVAVGADGNVYVGLLSGAPFPEGAAKVVRITPAGQVSDAATGLTAVTGVAMGPDRTLYVSEIFRLDLSAQPPQMRPGRVLRVLANGTTQVVAENLNTPNGLAFDRAGNLYVVTGSTTPNGQVLRCAAVAGAIGLPATGGGPAVPEGTISEDE